MCKNPGLGPSDYKPKPKTIYDLKIHETLDVHVGYKFYHHETGIDEAKKYIKVMRVEGGWIYGVDTQTPSFVPQASESNKEEPPSPPTPPPVRVIKEDIGKSNSTNKNRSVGDHKRVFEYDGLYHCLDCDAKWGAGWRVLEVPPPVCETKSNEPDRTVEAPPLDFVNESTGERSSKPTPPPTTEYVGGNKDNTTVGIMARAVRRFFGGKD